MAFLMAINSENGNGLVKKRPFGGIRTIKFSLNTCHIYYN